ncbi:L-aminoadipate-semialdehyde dehydrogenase [Pyricularia oryzae Y34]|uniref:L-aminoadipate-semialdehyde dehydrogenase n=1 Tax=Pyricularia oryzae (strain Y34) TaxID=1143189 RepID=A0AA97NRS9_PYRO3|nr:L-aminoadipate-semialdehyde dehydrogenase [Pyricularia oryzae Y34]
MVMEEGEQGLDLLKSMSLVGFGGAALPTSIGDDLVNKGVRLISRMGSAECGFLLCSARDDFDTDKEWQFLRCKVDDDMLAFEQRDGGLFELVVKPGWPLKEHANRSDGSFATADLFEQHPTIMNAWRYHSRADTQIALDNGKKFDPSPIEDAILAQVPTLLEGVLVFGAGRTYPGALLFSKEGLADSSSVIDTVWPVMDKVNNSSPSHARISREMLVLVPNTNGQPPLEKSSKGTIMRGKAEKQYLRYIEGAYTPAVTDEKKGVGVEDIPASVYQKFTQVAGRELDCDEDLYLQGVDSMACSQIRRLIEAEIMPVDKSKLPMNVIYDNGSINKLGKFLQELINSKQAPQFETLMPHVWMVRLEEVLRESDHSSKALLQFWKDRYARRPVNGVGYGGMQTKPSFRVTEAQRASRAISDIKPLDQEAILNMWGWIQTNKLGSGGA